MEIDSENELETHNIKIQVKSQARTEEFMLDAEQPIKEIKPNIAERFNAEPENVCLIFAGRFLKDEQSLKEQNVKDGFVLHLVIRGKNNANSSQPPPEARITQESQDNNLADLTRRILSNPEYVRLLINADPHLTAFMEQHPEVAHAINNPNLLREYLQISTNPNMMQEFLRNQDLTIRNIENMPGGFAALERIYSNLEDISPNPANSTYTTVESSNSQQLPSTQINSNPLPNPWSNNNNNNNNEIPSPELINEMLSNPQMLELLQGLSQDPEFVQSILSNYTPAANNPEFANFLQTNLPSFIQSLSQTNPDQNPEATYSDQLEQLSLMGFNNREENLSALRRSMGDINAAIDILTRNLV